MFMGNKSLRAAGEKVLMTKEQIDEYIKCKDDILYFAEHFYHIQTIDDGRIKIKLWDYQKKLLKAYENPPNNKRHVIVVLNRQAGKTTTTNIYLLHNLLFKKDANIAILANSEKTAKKILAQIKMAYQLLPLWLQKGIVTAGWNALSVELENGLKITASSTSSNSIVGETCNLLYIDEVSKIPEHLFDDFYSSVLPTISSGKTSKIIMTSTPKGLNAFYNIYKSAVRNENSYYPIKLAWNARPDRTPEWAEETKKNMTPQQWAQEFMCQFLGSSNTLVLGEILEEIDTRLPIDFKYSHAMSIYEYPEENASYVLGVDSAKGLGSDYSVIQVLRIYNDKQVEQVAVYRNNLVDPETFSGICVDVANYYNGAAMMVENNDIGEMVVSKIWNEYEYENLVNYDPKGLGIRSTKKTKFEGNLLLKKYIENKWLKINDRDTVTEISKYTEVSPNVFHCESQNGNDDLVVSLIWSVFFLTSDFYDPTTNSKTDSKESRKYDDNDTPTFLSSEDIHSNFFGNAFSNDFQNPQNDGSGFQNSQNNDIYFGNGYN
jgi:hypothetical protein